MASYLAADEGTPDEEPELLPALVESLWQAPDQGMPTCCLTYQLARFASCKADTVI